MHTIADFANDWIHWIDAEQQFVYVSPSCEKMTGYTPEEFYKDSQLINRIIDRQDENLVTSHFEEHKDGLLHAIEFKIITKTGAARAKR